ncbi:MAG: XRE family transcriptional regulator [Oscillospiraceae bacterium]|nr:XRE family transcriptional regulator [Oscillospiraceae bacterium]
MSTIGSRIRARRIELGLSQDELGKKLGYKSRSSINKIELNQRNLTQSKIKAIADALDTTPAYIMGWEQPNSPLFSPLPKMKEWRVIGATACGTPLHQETPWETVEAPEDIEGDVVFRCVGDSMIAARIFDGDLVFVKLKPEIENGQIGVVRIGEEYTLKRLYAYPDYVELRAENPTVQAIILRGKELEDFEIVGEAVTFLSAVR